VTLDIYIVNALYFFQCHWDMNEKYFKNLKKFDKCSFLAENIKNK
jgi:hypothetical protein